MDLRVIKTEKSIKNAFIELRKKKPVEKITVKELSEIAVINKATFYLHYSDIYELADEVENTVIQEIFDELTCLGCIFEKPSELTREIVTAFYKRHEIISILFSDIRSGKLVDKIEQEIKKRTLNNDSSIESQMMLTFLIQGSFHTAIKYKNEDAEKVYSTLSEFVKTIVESYSVQH